MKEVLCSVFRHKGKAALFFSLVMISVVIITMLVPKTYRSEGKLYLRLGRENATLDPTATLGDHSIVAVPQSRENEINSVAEMVQSRALLEKVVDKLSPAVVLEEDAIAASGDNAVITEPRRETQANSTSNAAAASTSSYSGNMKNGVKALLGMPVMSDLDKALKQIADNLKVEPVRKSNVIEISYIGGSPKSAQAVVAAIIDEYLAEHVRLNRPQGSHDFFAEQTSQLRGNLEKKEQSLRDLKNKTGLTSTRDQRQQLITRIGRLEDDLLTADTARAVSDAKVTSLRKKLSELPATQVTQEVSGYGNEGTDRMRDQLYALHVKEKEAASKYTGEHPKLQQIRDQIEQAKALLAREERTRTQVTKEPDRLYQQTQMELLAEEPVLASLNARTRELRGQLSICRNELKTFNENELRVAELEREVEMLDGQYRKYSASLEQARIDRALELQNISNINIAQAATYEAIPVSPRPKLNLLLGLGAGLFGAFGLCLAWDKFNKSLRTPEEAEKNLSLPILATIPRLKSKQLSCNGKK